MIGQSLILYHHMAEAGSCLVEGTEASFMDAIWQMLLLQVGDIDKESCLLNALASLLFWHHRRLSTQVTMELLMVKAAYGGIGFKRKPWTILGHI